MNLAKEGLVDDFGDLTSRDFEYFKDTVFQLTGIYLTPAKRELVKSRLRSYIQSRGLRSYSDYRDYLSSLSEDDQEWQKFVNFFTTNKTDFFREPQHFSYLSSTVIPNWLSRHRGELKVWCCASSTGQEPYTLAMVIDHALPEHFSYRILATDIDTDVLQRAKNGVYSTSKLSEIPIDFQNDFVDLGGGDVSGWFRISGRIQKNITFKQHNLIDSAYPGEEVFDLIFCRNVLIYFTPETIRTLMYKLHRSLKKDGLLFISHSESISRCSDLFQMIMPSIYKKVASDG